MFQPGYIKLYLSGELERRMLNLEAQLECCTTCPWQCKVNRLKGKGGFCRSGHLPIIGNVCDHHGEEPVISGTRGSGAIFFGNCNLKCVYCQNHQISQDKKCQLSKEIGCRELASEMIHLQNDLGCHNINLVSPSPFVPHILRTIHEAVPMGLKVPLVYNTNAYDSVYSLQNLEGIVDIYLPDLKYSSDNLAMKYSQARNYVYHSRQAISEMYKQVGNLVVNDEGMAQRGLIVRHLILPNDIAGSRDSLTWLKRDVDRNVTVSIMSQYFPCHNAQWMSPLSRKISEKEYKAIIDLLDELGLDNGWVQEIEAPENYLPDFERDGHPFNANTNNDSNTLRK